MGGFQERIMIQNTHSTVHAHSVTLKDAKTGKTILCMFDSDCYN